MRSGTHDAGVGGDLATGHPPAPAPASRFERRPALWREAIIGLLTFALYAVVAHQQTPGRQQSARDHAGSIISLEQRTHLDIEPALNSWLIQHHVLRAIADYEYAFTYILSAFLLLTWLYLKRPHLYRWARTSFVTLNVLAIGVFYWYPVAPPRLMGRLGFVDTVRDSHTWGSWGSSAVDDANQLAAMPSLHLAWALWVSVMLGLVAGTVRKQLVRSQAVSLLHVVLTFFVIVATANHYVLDAIGGAVVVLASLPVAAFLRPRERSTHGHPPLGERVAAADAFFLHVETPHAAQNVGGLLVLGLPADAPVSTPSRDTLEQIVRSQIGHLPRFQQRLSHPSLWRRPRWVGAEDIDWSWHVAEHDLRGPGAGSGDAPAGLAALDAYVAALLAAPLPRDRPLWRFVAIHGVGEGQSAAVIMAHHVIADGFGTVAQALRLLTPMVATDRVVPESMPGPFARAAATATGLAQLAVGGRAQKFAGADSADRGLATVSFPLDDFRAISRALQVRVTDVVLCLVAGGLAQTRPDVGGLDRLRVSVTLLVPRSDGIVEGNATGAAIVDVPAGPMDEGERLTRISEVTPRLRSGTRALAARFVMDRLAEGMPPRFHVWFSHTVYGGRFFHAVVSNIPGPDVQLSLAGLPMTRGYPLLPLAPKSPLTVGALGISGRLSIGLSTHPSLVPDVAAFEAAIDAVYEDLREAARGRTGLEDPNGSTRVTAPRRARG